MSQPPLRSGQHGQYDVPRRLRGVRFDRVLAELIPEHSKAQLQKLVRRGQVRIDGKRVHRSNFTLTGGELIELHLDGPEGSSAGSPATSTVGEPLRVLHEDPDLVVVDKPAGMLTHPTERLAGGTLAELAVERFGSLPNADDSCRPGIVHRLDRGTSGVLVLARTEHALDHLREQFRRGSVEKRYLALVYGVPREREQRVELAVGPIPGEPDRQRVDPRGRACSSLFRILRAGPSFSLIECLPKTGRRHQLRVHLAALGHPIVGDPLYRPGPGTEKVRGVKRLALHAQALCFDHPRDGARREHEAAPPEEFQSLEERLLGR